MSYALSSVSNTDDGTYKCSVVYKAVTVSEEIVLDVIGEF